ncbi:MAG: NAD(P)/FAD-dependent oxidoreductase [Anaerolineales bacterium]
MADYKVVIIGAGPAGLTAALQLQRQGIPPLLLERHKVGGLLNNAHRVENYPGFVEGISGPDLVDLFRRQAERLGVIITLEEVIAVEYQDKLFRIATNKREILTKILVAATGTKAKSFPTGSFSGNLESKIFSEVFPLLKEEGKTILIVGAGDAAFDYALNLASKNQVIILNRGKSIKGLSLLWNRVQENDSIKYFPETEIEEIISSEKGSITVLARSGSKRKNFKPDYLLTAIGREPELGFADGEFFKQAEGLQNQKVLYLIGDLQNDDFRQTSIAVGDGIRAAMEIEQKLEKG